MNRPTPQDAEQAAELLGLNTWDLALIFRYEAAAELERVAGRVKSNEDEPIDVGRARRLHRAATAALKAHDDVQEAMSA